MARRGVLMKLILEHLSSRACQDKEKLGAKIEEYLKKNGFRYIVNDPYSYIGGITVFLEGLGESESLDETEQIGKLSDLASFLFETLQLDKTSLHFVFKEYKIDGTCRVTVASYGLDKTIFQELTGEILPPKLKRKTLSDFEDDWKKGKL